VIVVRELDERLGFGELIEQHLIDPRGTNTRLSLCDLLRQSVYSRLAGYEDVNDAEHLSQDPAFRLIGSEKIWDRGAALTSRLQSFETELLAEEENLAGLARIDRELIGKAEAIDSPRRVVLETWTAPRFPFTASKSKAPAPGTSSPPAITLCCCSTAREIVWARSCGLATFTVPRTGMNCCYRRLSASRSKRGKWCFAPMLPLLSQRSTKRWRSAR
jgi:hypothetical protein